MSTTELRVPLHDADLVAAELLDVLAPACERIPVPEERDVYAALRMASVPPGGRS